jgi:hypothetical protein
MLTTLCVAFLTVAPDAPLAAQQPTVEQLRVQLHEAQASRISPRWFIAPAVVVAAGLVTSICGLLAYVAMSSLNAVLEGVFMTTSRPDYGTAWGLLAAGAAVSVVGGLGAWWLASERTEQGRHIDALNAQLTQAWLSESLR